MKKGWKPFSPQKLIGTRFRGKWINGYPGPDPKKAKKDYPKEPNKAHKNTLKEEITENFMEMVLDMVNQNIQEALKKCQDNKNKEYEKTQK
jgi:hypothetical protein